MRRQTTHLLFLPSVCALALLVGSSILAAQDKQVLRQAAAASDSDKLFYDANVVQTVRLRVAEQDLQRMHAALPKRIYVPASFQWRDKSIRKVAIRYKGNSSSNPNQRHKRSFLVKFDEYDSKQRFLGLRRVSFDNGVQFGSLFSEPIITEILRDQGIATHRCNYAKLYLNDEYKGVYVNVERVDQSFVERRLTDSQGSLFKVDLGGPGCNLQFLGDDPKSYERTFEPKTKSAKKDLKNLVNLIKMINQSPPEDFARQLESKIEVDSFLRIVAVMLFSGAFDQLTGWNPHNYYLYHDRQRDRWTYLPWDLDVGFAETAFGRVRVLADWNAAWPVAGGKPNPLLERIVADPRLLQRYRQIAGQVLEKYFEPGRLTKVIEAKYQLIKKDLKTDPFPQRRATSPKEEGYAEIVESMKQFVRKRYETARQQLESPGQRPRIVRRTPGPGSNQPRPGPASKDAPTKLSVVSKSADSVVLSWQDNADKEFAYIVQRTLGDGKEFRNHIGRPGENVTRATDRNVQVGQTYRYRVYAIRATPQGPRGSGVSNVVTVLIEK